jgi:hypothetical protein
MTRDVTVLKAVLMKGYVSQYELAWAQPPRSKHNTQHTTTWRMEL